MRYVINLPKSHPYKEGKGILVDYNIASIVLPMIVTGATIGVMINQILPSIVVAVILTIILTFFSWKTLMKLLKI